MLVQKIAPLVILPLLLFPSYATPSDSTTGNTQTSHFSNSTRALSSTSVAKCTSQPIAAEPLTTSTEWMKSISIPTGLNDGAPTGTTSQRYAVFPNGTLEVFDAKGANFVVRGLAGLPNGTLRTSLIGNSTEAYQSEILVNGNSVLANITTFYSIHYQLCQPTGLKVSVIGKILWPAGWGTISILLGSQPTFLPVTRTPANKTVSYNPTTAFFSNDLGFDWSDSKALDPVYNATENSIGYRVGSSFVIDPVTVATSAVSNPTRSDYQGHTCYANGRFWVFFSDGSHEGYVSSTDGGTWNSETTFVTSGVQAGYFAFYCSGTSLYYVNAASTTGSGMYYRYGTLTSTGGITWSISEGEIASTNTLLRGMSTTLDSSGGWWTAFGSQVDTFGIEVWYCANPSSCSWTHKTSIPTTNNGFVPYAEVVPLSGGKMAVVWTTGTGTLGSLGIETFSTTAWSSAAFASGSYRIDSSSCVSIGTTIECGVASNNAAVGYIAATYGNNSPSWSSFATLTSCSSSTDCSASISTDGSSLFVGFTKSTTTAGYFKSPDTGASWGNEIDFSTSQINPNYLSTPLVLRNDLQAVWTSCSTSSCSSWSVTFAHDGFYEMLPCPANAYLCWQFGGTSYNSNTATVSSSCNNPYTGNTNCFGFTPYCTTPSPCYGVQLNFYTTPCSSPPCVEQVVLHASPPGSSGPNPGYWSPIFEWFTGTQQGNKQEPPLLPTTKWYQEGVTLAIYQNGTAFWGVEGVDGSKMTLVDNPFGTSHGTPGDATFEGANVGNSYGEYATFSSNYYWQWVFTAPSFPSQHGCGAGVWYWGESGPTTKENSNLC